MPSKTVTLLILLLLLAAGCSNSLQPDTVPPQTKAIRFALPDTSHVKLWIENAYQTRVRTLVDKVKQPGSYTVNFHMVDEKGNALSYGLYTYHISTDSLSVTRTFIYEP